MNTTHENPSQASYLLSLPQEGQPLQYSQTQQSGKTTVKKLGTQNDDGSSMAGIEMASLQESQISLVPSSELSREGGPIA